MLTVAIGGIAVFLLVVALVLAILRVRRLALVTVCGAVALAMVSAVFAVVGVRRWEHCTASETIDQRLNEVLGTQSDCVESEALGVHDPF